MVKSENLPNIILSKTPDFTRPGKSRKKIVVANFCHDTLCSMNIIDSACTLLNTDLNTLLPPSLRWLNPFPDETTGNLRRAEILKLAEHSRKSPTDSVLPAPESAGAQSAEAAESPPATLPFRRLRALEGADKIEVMDWLSHKSFQVDNQKEFQILDDPDANISAQGNDDLLICFRAQFRDSARSFYDFHLSVYAENRKSRDTLLELTDLDMTLEQLSGEEKRTVVPDISASGRLVFRGLDSGAVYRFRTSDAEGVPVEFHPVRELSAYQGLALHGVRRA